MPAPRTPHHATSNVSDDISTNSHATQREGADPPMSADPITVPGPGLLLVSAEPFNAETRLALQRGVITPTADCYVRSHFAVPHIDLAAWRLRIEGDVDRPVELTLDALLALPTLTLVVTWECAGNGRSAMRPQPVGEPWQYGAVSTSEWTGVPLHAVLATAGLSTLATHVVIEGADGGYVPDGGRTLSYARSLTRDQALHPDTLLAYAMNGVDIPSEHGFPIRLVVPGWYGMAAVKWVTKIIAQSHPFDGFYQVDRYVMAHVDADGPVIAPLDRMRIRSVMAVPAGGARLLRGVCYLRGFAWSGAGPITRVEVSVDGGRLWEAADLTSEPARYTWRRWEYCWHATASGPATLMSRAFDADGNRQPTEPEWNRLGYANNAIQRVEVLVT